MSLNRHRPSLIVCLLLGGLILAGCTSNATDGPNSTAGTTPSASVTSTMVSDSAPIVSSAPASPTPSVIDVPSASVSGSASLDPAAQEAADRAAVEAQWVKFWEVYNNIVRTPRDERSSALHTVSVDPVKSKILQAAQDFDSQGLDYFGFVVQHPHWVTPINGQSLAVMRDCQDQSQYGSIYVASGEKRSVGVARNSLQAGFVLGDDGIWRVQNFNHLGNVPC